MGVALAVNVAVQGPVQALSVDILVARGRQAVHQVYSSRRVRYSRIVHTTRKTSIMRLSGIAIIAMIR